MSTKSYIEEKICYCCGYVYHSRHSTKLNIVLYRVLVNELVCSDCWWDIPEHIDESQYKKYLDYIKRRYRDG